MEFDREMLRFAKNARLFDSKAALLSLQEEEKILVFRRTQKILAFNFHPTLSQTRCFIPTAKSGTFRVTLTTDEKRFGGWDRISTDYLYRAKKQENGKIGFFLYLPARSAVCLELWNEKKER